MKALIMAPMGSVHRRFNKANIEALQSLGYEVHILANFDVGEGTEKQNQEFVEQCRKEGIITHSIPYQRHTFFGNLSKIKVTRELLKREKYSIVHTNTETGGLILRLVGKPFKQSKYIYSPHGMSFYKGSSLKSQIIYRPIERWICSGMDCNLAVNEEEFLVQQFWNKNKAHYIHGTGINLDCLQNITYECFEKSRKELGIPMDAKVIMSTGELDDNKNHQVIIHAIAALKRQDLYYIICGIGPNKDKLEQLSISLGIGNQVKLLGYRKDIPELLKASDLFALPSFHEGLSVALMEAMASGLPVVCSKIRGNVDLIDEGVNGLLCNPSSIEEFSDSISKIISSKEDAIIMGQNGRNKATAFSFDSVFKELKEIYEEF